MAGSISGRGEGKEWSMGREPMGGRCVVTSHSGPHIPDLTFRGAVESNR